MEKNGIFFAKYLCCLFHVFHYRNLERASDLARTALNTFRGSVGKNCVMLPDSFGYLPLGFDQIQKFGDGCHVDPLGAGGAVTAVHTVALPANPGERGKGRGVIPLLL